MGLGMRHETLLWDALLSDLKSASLNGSGGSNPFLGTSLHTGTWELLLSGAVPLLAIGSQNECYGYNTLVDHNFVVLELFYPVPVIFHP